jgi:soluble lytic murein transglycosylase-like protein
MLQKGERMKKITMLFEIILLIVGLSFLSYSTYNFSKVLPVPIVIEKKPDKVFIEARNALRVLNAPNNRFDDLAHAVTNASKMTNLSPSLIVSLMYTESEFKYTAVSKKGYRGLMQTPWASHYADVDILYGCKILKDKLYEANNDLLFALALYKGGNNPEAKKYAKETHKLYLKVKKDMKGVS